MLVSTASCLDTSQLALWNILHRDLIRKKILLLPIEIQSNYLFQGGPHYSELYLNYVYITSMLQEGDNVTFSSNTVKEAFNVGKPSFSSSERISSLIKASFFFFFNFPLINHHRLLSTFCIQTTCSSARREVAAESREAPAADVWGSNTIQVCRFPPAPSLCHRIQRGAK